MLRYDDLKDMMQTTEAYREAIEMFLRFAERATDYDEVQRYISLACIALHQSPHAVATTPFVHGTHLLHSARFTGHRADIAAARRYYARPRFSRRFICELNYAYTKTL